MKTLFASLLAAAFALACVSTYAAVPAAGTAVYDEDSKDDSAKKPTTDQKDDEDSDKKKKDDDKS
ncbi:MAG TPA: hypothetical protein VMI15_07130 [Burkholderiales bacterium]|nr:hypothetical protein [Burkholderiales bacterium]